MPARRKSREIELLVQAFIGRLTEAVESAIAARARVLSEEYLRAAAAAPRHPEPRAGAIAELPSPTEAPAADAGVPSQTEQADPPRPAQVRPKRQRTAPVIEAKAAPAIDPEEQRRAAELAGVVPFVVEFGG
jgi:hypothetical protein